MNKFFSYIIVTGSEGFIGKHLVAYLQSLGITVWCVDKKINIPITEVENILSQHKIDAVIHLAAQASVFGDDKNSMVDDNIKVFIGNITSSSVGISESFGVRLTQWLSPAP